MSKWAWLIVGAIVGIVAYAFVVVFRPYEDSNTIGAPKNYYYLPIESGGEIVCTDPKSNSKLIGVADIFAYPTEGRPDRRPDHYMIVASNAGVKEEDWRKPIKSDEDAQRFVELLRSLKPHTLLHLQRVDNKTVLVFIYKRKQSSWEDTLKFWVSRFDKEWELLDTQTYDPNDITAGASMMKKAYGDDCQLIY